MINYILTALLWVTVCLGIGFYIIGKGIKEKLHYKIGFLTIGISYIIGVVLLVIIVIVH